MILVIGANGLVGSYLVRYLLRSGEQVRGLRRPGSDLSLLGDDAHKVNWVIGDINDIQSLENAMQGIDRVYHAAGAISYLRKDYGRLLKVNVEGTINVMQVAFKNRIKKLLYVSGTMSLGRGKADITLHENDENVDSNYDTTYALSKCLAEMEVWQAMMKGLNAVIICPVLVMGAGWWKSYGPGMFPWVERGFPFYPSGSTGFVDVRDVAKASIALMNSNIHNERYIVGSANLSYKEMADMIAANFKSRKPFIPAPQWFASMIAVLEVMQARLNKRLPIISIDSLSNFYRNYSYSSEKIKQQFGYKFIPIEQTVKETCEAYVKSKAEGKNFGILPIE